MSAGLLAKYVLRKILVNLTDAITGYYEKYKGRDNS